MISLLLVLLSSIASAAAAANWTVPARVSVASEDVALADLVERAPARWAAVALGKAPSPGGQRILNRDWVLQRAREVGAEGSIDMPEAVVLTRPGRLVERDDVIRAVEEALSPRLGPGEAMRVVSVGQIGMLPEGELRLRVAAPEGELPAALTVWVDIESNGRKAGQTWARVEMSRSVPVLVLVRSARRGAVLGSGDVEQRLVKAGVSSRQALTDPGEVVGKRLVRSLQAGAPLSATDVEVAPLVEKGDLVHLVARAGAVVATTLGRALEPGRLGEEVRVENVGSGRIVQGVLRESGVVDVRSSFGR